MVYSVILFSFDFLKQIHMGIIRYIPKKREVIDRRTENGGYYEAVCNECGNAFYPQRSSAKYCSRSCAVMAYRKSIIAKPTKSIVKTPKVAEMVSKEVFSSREWAVKYLKDNYKHVMSGKVAEIRKKLKNMEVNTVLDLEAVKVRRISPNKYAV